jgi:hypothetical protein
MSNNVGHKLRTQFTIAATGKMRNDMAAHAREHKKGHSSRPFYLITNVCRHFFIYLCSFSLCVCIVLSHAGLCYESEMKFTKNVSGSYRINFHALKLMSWVEASANPFLVNLVTGCNLLWKYACCCQRPVVPTNSRL